MKREKFNAGRACAWCSTPGHVRSRCRALKEWYAEVGHTLRVGDNYQKYREAHQPDPTSPERQFKGVMTKEEAKKLPRFYGPVPSQSSNRRKTYVSFPQRTRGVSEHGTVIDVQGFNGGRTCVWCRSTGHTSLKCRSQELWYAKAWREPQFPDWPPEEDPERQFKGVIEK